MVCVNLGPAAGGLYGPVGAVTTAYQFTAEPWQDTAPALVGGVIEGLTIEENGEAAAVFGGKGWLVFHGSGLSGDCAQTKKTQH